jgi:hypothetical protein
MQCFLFKLTDILNFHNILINFTALMIYVELDITGIYFIYFCDTAFIIRVMVIRNFLAKDQNADIQQEQYES